MDAKQHEALVKAANAALEMMAADQAGEIGELTPFTEEEQDALRLFVNPLAPFERPQKAKGSMIKMTIFFDRQIDVTCVEDLLALVDPDRQYLEVYKIPYFTGPEADADRVRKAKAILQHWAAGDMAALFEDESITQEEIDILNQMFENEGGLLEKFGDSDELLEQLAQAYEEWKAEHENAIH